MQLDERVGVLAPASARTEAYHRCSKHFGKISTILIDPILIEVANPKFPDPLP
jgi:hypothetical protein